MDKFAKVIVNRSYDGVMDWKTVICQKMKKCYVYVTFPSFDKYCAALSNKFLKENALFGTSVHGAMFVCDERIIADTIKLYLKYLSSKTLTRDVGMNVDYNQKFKIDKVSVTIIGKCKSFARTNVEKESAKLKKLAQFVKELKCKQRVNIEYGDEYCIHQIQNTQQPNLKSTIAVGSWYIPFEFAQSNVFFYDRLELVDINTFKSNIKYVCKKCCPEATRELILCMAKLHGMSATDVDTVIEKITDAAKAWRALTKQVTK